MQIEVEIQDRLVERQLFGNEGSAVVVVMSLKT